MKSTGMLRPVDKMGRVVIPKELRDQLGIKNEQDSFEIYMEDDKIILKKYQPTCIFCDSTEACFDYEGRLICKKCLTRLSDIKENIEDIERLAKNGL